MRDFVGQWWRLWVAALLLGIAFGNAAEWPEWLSLTSAATGGYYLGWWRWGPRR